VRYPSGILETPLGRLELTADDLELVMLSIDGELERVAFDLEQDDGTDVDLGDLGEDLDDLRDRLKGVMLGIDDDGETDP
jgi:hypothetical protein